MLLLSGDGWRVIEVLLVKVLRRFRHPVLVLESWIGTVSRRLPLSITNWSVVRCWARLSLGCVSDRFRFAVLIGGVVGGIGFGVAFALAGSGS